MVCVRSIFAPPLRSSGASSDAACTIFAKSVSGVRAAIADQSSVKNVSCASAGAVFAMIEKGAVKIEINQRYPLSDIVQAHTDLEGGRTSGSTIITP